jgi:hypothetical protein
MCGLQQALRETKSLYTQKKVRYTHYTYYSHIAPLNPHIVSMQFTISWFKHVCTSLADSYLYLNIERRSDGLIDGIVPGQPYIA